MSNSEAEGGGYSANAIQEAVEQLPEKLRAAGATLLRSVDFDELKSAQDPFLDLEPDESESISPALNRLFGMFALRRDLKPYKLHVLACGLATGVVTHPAAVHLASRLMRMYCENQVHPFGVGMLRCFLEVPPSPPVEAETSERILEAYALAGVAHSKTGFVVWDTIQAGCVCLLGALGRPEVRNRVAALAEWHPQHVAVALQNYGKLKGLDLLNLTVDGAKSLDDGSGECEQTLESSDEHSTAAFERPNVQRESAARIVWRTVRWSGSGWRRQLVFGAAFYLLATLGSLSTHTNKVLTSGTLPQAAFTGLLGPATTVLFLGLLAILFSMLGGIVKSPLFEIPASLFAWVMKRPSVEDANVSRGIKIGVLTGIHALTLAATLLVFALETSGGIASSASMGEPVAQGSEQVVQAAQDRQRDDQPMPQRPSQKQDAPQREPRAPQRQVRATPTATQQQPISMAAPEGMVLVPAGTFAMGAEATDGSGTHARQVRLSQAFFIDRTEVTAQAYAGCVTSGRCTPTSIHGPASSPRQIEELSSICTENDPEKTTFPINCLDYRQAQDYCAAQGTRLPSEAEWEYAARGNDNRSFPWGEESPIGCELAAMSGCTKKLGPVALRPRGAGPFGTLDQAGNVWEWVADGWSDTPEGLGAENPLGPPPKIVGVLRGGSWDFAAKSSRAFSRLKFSAGSGHVSTGVRCAKSAG